MNIINIKKLIMNKYYLYNTIFNIFLITIKLN